MTERQQHAKTLVELIELMHSKKPAGVVLTAQVVSNVLKKKFGDNRLAGANIDSMMNLIQSTIARLEKPPVDKFHSDTDSSDDDSDSSGDSEEDAEVDEESSEEDEEEFDSSDDDDDDDDDVANEPAQKKARTEGTAQNASAVDGPEGRVLSMTNCVNKVGLHVPRKRAEDETAESYLRDVLIPFFEKQGWNPAAHTDEDAKRYKKKREVDMLLQDGADMHLDRTSRRGRGVPPPPPQAAVAKPAFLDDD